MENGKLIAIVSFALGMAVGANLLKIKRWIPIIAKKIRISGGNGIDKLKKATKKVEMSIVEALENNPQGKTLVELGKILGIPFVKLAYPIRNLVDAGKVRKNDKFYTLSTSSV